MGLVYLQQSRRSDRLLRAVFFIFLFFIFVFYKKYIFDLEIYRNIPRPPGSGAAGAFLKKISRSKLRAGPWGPVARQRGGRPPRPLGCGATGRNFCNLALFAKEFHIYAFFVTFCRNRRWGRRRNMWRRDNTSWLHISRCCGATHAQAI